MKLYELAGQYEAILLEVAEAEGELSVDLEARLESIGDLLTVKIDSCAAMVRTLDAEAAAYKAEAALHTEKRRVAEAAVVRLKTYMQTALTVAQQRSVKGKRFTVALQASAPTVELLAGVTAEALPLEFRRTKVTHEVDKTALKDALKAGDEAALAVAELRTSSHVRIR